MIAFLMAYDYKLLTHVRVGKPDDLNVLIRKAKGVKSRFPYITDSTGRTLWVDPDCARHAIALYGADTHARNAQNRAQALTAARVAPRPQPYYTSRHKPSNRPCISIGANPQTSSMFYATI